MLLMLQRRDAMLKTFRPFETAAVAVMLGLGFFSLLMLMLGMIGQAANGTLVCGLTLIGIAGAIFLLTVARRAFFSADPVPPPASTPPLLSQWLIPLLLLPALLTLFGSAVVPSNDYDVLSYHLEGAKEIHQSGRIAFAEHNVYMNMPFGAEMHAVWGMTLAGDWRLGGAVGKLLIAAMTVCAALGIHAFCRRFLPAETAGVAGPTAALLYLQTPWINMVSGAGLVDGVFAAYLLFAILLFCSSWRECPETGNIPSCREGGGGLRFLAGVFAGCAAACKYPAVPFLLVPLGAVAGICAWRRHRRTFPDMSPSMLFASACRSAAWPVLGMALGGGLWYVKNALLIGNPVFPLLASFFPVEGWDATVNQRWQAAHAAHDFSVAALLRSAWQVLVGSPLLEPLLWPLAGLGTWTILEQFGTEKNGDASKNTRFVLWGILVYSICFFAGWWLVTHRIDRFWLPIMPLLAVLAGLGAARLTDLFGRKSGSKIVTLLLILAATYCFLINASPMPGKNVAFLAPLDAPGRLTPWTRQVNDRPLPGMLAVIGEANVYEMNVPLCYATCWNRPPLEDVLAVGREPKEVLRELHRRNIGWILVHWGEIRRFRGPGNYGFSHFPTPDIFRHCVDAGILMPLETDEESRQAGVEIFQVRLNDEHVSGAMPNRRQIPDLSYKKHERDDRRVAPATRP